MKPLLIQYSTIASRNTDPFKWQAAGMGYAIRTGAGRFIVVDGGHPNDAEPLVELLERYAAGKPQVDLWIITHPHGDHYGALSALSKNEALRERIRLNRLCMRMPAADVVYTAKGAAAPGEIQSICALKVLLTVADLAEVTDPNETSMIFRVEAAGQSILFLGDTYAKPSRQLAAQLGDALKCDFCQLAHHALNGGAHELYALARPEVALIPMTRPAYDAMLFGEYKDSHSTRHNRHAMQALAVSRHWLSADGDRVVELPCDFSQWT